MGNKTKRAGIYNKKMLEARNKHAYESWLLDDSDELKLPSVPTLPFVSASSKEDTYFKTQVAGYSADPKHKDHDVCFVEKNQKPHGMYWRTSAEHLRQAVRWGIVATESITSKTIGALGQYRVIENERIIKGLISNTHQIKIALVDHYQDRFEALQQIESLVNKNSISTLHDDFSQAFQAYIDKLKDIQKNIDKNFDITTILHLHEDIENDIVCAQAYLKKVSLAHKNNDHEALRAFNRARGNDSVLEFVKRRMTQNLYEMQGINQDITYSHARPFALTRGALNDCIEDARKSIDDHRADPRNLILPEHHGIYGEGDATVVYNFKKDHLSPEREREVIGAISAIQKWDEAKYNAAGQPELHVSRAGATRVRPLKVVNATNWSSSVSFTVFVKKVGWIVANALLSIFGRTQTLDENAWQTKNHKGKYEFASVASEIRRSPYVRTYTDKDPWYIKAIKLIFAKRGIYGDSDPWYKKVEITILGGDVYSRYDTYFARFKKIIKKLKEVAFSEAVRYRGARANDPLWYKPIGLLGVWAGAGINVLMGFWDVLRSLVNELPQDIYYDYKAAGELRPLKDVQQAAQEQINDIESDLALYMNGYELCFMPTDNQALERNKFYITEKFSPDRKHSWLVYSVINPDGDEISGRLTSADLGGSIWDFPTNGKVEDLREAFKSLLPKMLKVTSKRAHTQNCPNVNKLIGDKHVNDERPFQPYHGLHKAPHRQLFSKHAHMPWKLRPGDQNDIITAIVRGVDGFVSFFTLNFAKDPLGAVVFGTAYTFVGGSIILPKMFSFLGLGFEGWAQSLGLSVASGGASSAVAGACIVGQWGWGVVDVIEHGPQSGMVKSISMVLDNPLALGVGVSAAWLAGHLLTITIPVLRQDLGTNENIGKLTFGGKGAIALHEALHEAEQNPGKPIKFMVGEVELQLDAKPMTVAQKAQNDKFRFVSWLVERQDTLPYLSEGVKHKLAHHIDNMFKDNVEQATSLKHMIFPERAHSIAHQLVSIPLSYIPTLFRAVASCVSSMLTGSVKPMEIAWPKLGKKVLKDLSRLLVAAEGLVHLAVNIVATPFKVVTYLLNITIGRIGSIFGISTGHELHQFFALVHIAVRQLGELLFPARALKHMADEHHCSVMERVHGSQKMLIKELGVNVDVKPAISDAEKVPLPAKNVEVKVQTDDEYSLMDEPTSYVQAQSFSRSNQQ